MSRSDEKIDTVTLEEAFYSKELLLSYSALNKLLFSPRSFYKWYILEEREEKLDSYLIGGKVVHALLLLSEERFKEHFMILPGNLPTGNTRVVIDKIFNKEDYIQKEAKLSDFKENIITILKEINLHQSLKTDEQRVSKIVTEETESYWEFLKNKEGKDIIDQELLDECKEYADIMKNDPVISDLLKLNNTNKKIEVYNEHKLDISKIDGMPFGLKGILDNIVIDHTEKILYINDIKTTGKSITDFAETVEFYNYWLQAAIYIRLAVKLVSEDYEVAFTFIVIDKFQQVYPFKVSVATLKIWMNKLDEVLKQTKWHYENKRYKLPFKFENETVTL